MSGDWRSEGVLRSVWNRWSVLVVRRRWLVLAFWLAASLGLIPLARHLEGKLEVSARMPSGQAEGVRPDLERRFRSPFTYRVLLVAEGVPSPAVPEGRAALERIVGALRNVP